MAPDCDLSANFSHGTANSTHGTVTAYPVPVRGPYGRDMLVLPPLVVALLAVSLAVAPSAGADWSWPVPGRVITPFRLGADPYAPGQHRGIDIAGSPGTRVTAAAAGVVRYAGMAGSSGLTVAVRTADRRFDTAYLHLSAVVVRAGERVAVGQTLGTVGSTGRRSAAAPHLHFGVRRAASRHGYLDPLVLLPGDPAPRSMPPARIPAPVAVPASPPPGRPAAIPYRPAPLAAVPVSVPRSEPAVGLGAAPAPAAPPRTVPHGEPRPALPWIAGPDLGLLAGGLGLAAAAALVALRGRPARAAPPVRRSMARLPVASRFGNLSQNPPRARGRPSPSQDRHPRCSP